MKNQGGLEKLGEKQKANKNEKLKMKTKMRQGKSGDENQN